MGSLITLGSERFNRYADASSIPILVMGSAEEPMDNSQRKFGSLRTHDQDLADVDTAVGKDRAEGLSTGRLHTGDGAENAVLDDPVLASLEGHHAFLSRRVGRAVTYHPDVATFCAVPRHPDTEDWAALAYLLGRGALADLFSASVVPPADWDPVFTVDGLQMVAPATMSSWPSAARDVVPRGSEVVELDAHDLPAMFELVERTRPGPFWPRTPQLGTYLGIRHNGVLVAMAGERLHPPGWTEISAVCTAPDARGQGYAARLVQALTDQISARGERAFLHVIRSNVSAVRLYGNLGFRPRREVTFRGFRIP